MHQPSPKTASFLLLHFPRNLEMGLLPRANILSTQTADNRRNFREVVRAQESTRFYHNIFPASSKINISFKSEENDSLTPSTLRVPSLGTEETARVAVETPAALRDFEISARSLEIMFKTLRS